jgi:hypothetical protein
MDGGGLNSLNLKGLTLLESEKGFEELENAALRASH